MSRLHDPVIIALDLESAAEARALVTTLGAHANFYKVGLELYTAAGIEFVQELTRSGKRVFLDLKFHDIGETVKRATAQAARSGATFLSIHSSPKVMAAAVEGRGASSLKLLAVTVLTNMENADLVQEGYSREMTDLIQWRLQKAIEANVDGVIASPLEAACIRRHLGADRLLVTPGVRSRGATAGDQKRIATPVEALRDGADYIVVGRQVTRAQDPVAALCAIHAEIRES